ncbi:MAG: hypothetical protein COA66_04215 [Arcobacter sp.]|nr:MAG: hypothetical protein COA66_04215 [Arcobacter sp.]
MLKINKLKIEIETKDKNFGREIEFLTNGLTIIKGDNHSGKSTIASAIFYALGMEELLGGKNVVALDSILTSKVPYNSLDLNIITSMVLLEIENSLGDKIVLKRYIKHYEIEPKIIEIKSESSEEFYYLHDGGSATNEKGFYNYLEKFLDLSLPVIPKYEGSETKLYLQVIFNAFFIEQVKGWTDFFPAIPNYGIKDAKKRIIEYILDLKTFEYEIERNRYEDTKKDIVLEWDKLVNKIKNKIESVSATILGLPEETMGIDLLSKKQYDIWYKVNNEDSLSIENYLVRLINKKGELDKRINLPKNDTEKNLLELKEKLKNFLNDLISIDDGLNIKTNELEELKSEELHLTQEITNLTDLLKIKKYTSDQINTNKIFKGLCPTCDNPIAPSVYKHIKVMGLDDNKKYIKSQKDILSTYIKILKKEIVNEKSYYKQILEEYESDKKIIEYLEKDLLSNSNVPSLANMKELILVEDKIEKANLIKKELIEFSLEIKKVSKLWDINEKSREPFTMNFKDTEKLKLLESSFKLLLRDFKYDSKRDDQVNISKQDFAKYFPVVTIEYNKPQHIKHNSSASDFVRSIWAYLIALYEVSNIRNGNHLGLFLFDEPAQHAMTETSQAALFKTLSKLGCQSIVFASFENKVDKNQDKFKEVTKGLNPENYRVISIDDRAIKELN